MSVFDDDENAFYSHRVKRKNSPISLSGSDNEDNDLLEIKPPQPKIHKPGHRHKYSDKRDKSKHSTNKYDYHSSTSSGNYYKSHSGVSRYEMDRKHHRYTSDKEAAGYSKDYYSEPSARDGYHKSSKHHHSHHRVHDSKYESKPKEVRYAEEQQQALKDEIKKKEEELRAKLERRRHHQRSIKKENEIDVKNSNKFIQADRLKEAYHKESEERMRKHAKGYKLSIEVEKDKTPPRAYDTERSIPNVVVVSDESHSDEDKSSQIIIMDDSTLAASPSSAERREEIDNMSAIGGELNEVQRRNEQTEDERELEEEDSSEASEEEDEDEADDDDDNNDDEDMVDAEEEEGEEEEEEEEEDSSSSSSSPAMEEDTVSSSARSSVHSYDSPNNKTADKFSHRTRRQLHSDDEDANYRRKHSAERNDASKKLSSARSSPSKESESMQGDDNQSAQQQQQQSDVKLIIKQYFPALQGCRSVEQFHCLNKIEEGTYGIVYRARDKRTNQIVALKRLKMEKEKEGFPITSLREINTLLKAQHPNIVTVREIVVGSNMDKIFIVMDYVEHDLKSLMETMKQRKSSFLPGEVKCLMTQLLMAVDHLHDNWILHRDLKTSNLLFSHQGILKVGDFGLAREYGSPLKHYTSVVVTLWYRAPELLLGTKLYSTPIDMWSIGCIFAELILMEPLFTGKSDADQVNRIFKLLSTPSEQQWPDFRKLPVVQKVLFANYPNNVMRTKITAPMLTDSGYDLLLKFLTYDPKERITAEVALKHEYFKEHPIAIDPAMFPTWPAKSEPGYSKLKAESPKAPSGGQGYKDLGDDEGFFIGERTRGPNYNSTFCLKF